MPFTVQALANFAFNTSTVHPSFITTRLSLFDTEEHSTISAIVFMLFFFPDRAAFGCFNAFSRFKGKALSAKNTERNLLSCGNISCWCSSIDDFLDHLEYGVLYKEL